MTNKTNKSEQAAISVFARLQEVRSQLHKMDLKKSGKNKFSGFNYYELADILPAIDKLCVLYGICPIVDLGQIPTLTIYSTDNPADKITFTSNAAEAPLKGATAIQCLGAQQTYLRRYLFMNAFNIVEADALDAEVGNRDIMPQRSTYVGLSQSEKDEARLMWIDQKTKAIDNSFTTIDIKGVFDSDKDKKALEKLKEADKVSYDCLMSNYDQKLKEIQES